MCLFFCFWATTTINRNRNLGNGLFASITASKQLITLNRYAFLLPRDRPEISFYCRFDLLFLATIPVAKAKAYSFKIVQAFKMTHTPPYSHGFNTGGVCVKVIQSGFINY